MKDSSNIIFQNGFVAVTAVVLVSLGTITFSLVTFSAINDFADSVNRRELRIQSKLNAKGCLDTVILMLSKDYKLNGTVYIDEFGCEAKIANKHVLYPNTEDVAYIEVKTSLSGVYSRLKGQIKLENDGIRVI